MEYGEGFRVIDHWRDGEATILDGKLASTTWKWIGRAAAVLGLAEKVAAITKEKSEKASTAAHASSSEEER